MNYLFKNIYLCKSIVIQWPQGACITRQNSIWRMEKKFLCSTYRFVSWQLHRRISRAPFKCRRQTNTTILISHDQEFSEYLWPRRTSVKSPICYLSMTSLPKVSELKVSWDFPFHICPSPMSSSSLLSQAIVDDYMENMTFASEYGS